MEPTFRLRFLGAVQIAQDDEPVRGFESRKALALLGYLAAQRRPIPREQLVDLFWGDKPEKRGRANLSWALNKISTLLPDCLQADRHDVQFQRAAQYWLDIDAFGQLETQRDPRSLAAAVALYRGEFLEGLYLEGCPEFELWMVGEQERWRQRVVQALETLIAHHSQRGECEEGLRFARQLLTLEPWREETHRQVMRLLARSGQRSAALAQYETCRNILAQELGVEPLPETTALYERIQAATQARKPNLPVQSTRFVGREEDLAQVASMLNDPECRLLTILGPGGVGKTRLALQAAADQTEAFLEGVFFVSLAPISDPTLVASTIAQTLGIHGIAGQSLLECLKDYLCDKQMLLVLDNFEQVVQAAPMVNDLLAVAPQLKVLVTSRALLRVYGEHGYRVLPMALPNSKQQLSLRQLMQYEAIQLFVERAQALQPDFTVTTENTSAVTEICYRLDGLPLAIELAAARVRLLPPQKMLAQLNNRFRLLTSRIRGLPIRHQTLRNTIDWSYNLLKKEEKTLFRRLAMFTGGCTLEAAEVVCNASGDLDVLQGLESLMDQSLLKRSDLNGEPRFGMLETIREYALERLMEDGEAGALHRQYADFFLMLVEEAEPELRGASQVVWLNRLETEHVNLRTALGWALGNNIEIGLRLAAALYYFWEIRNFANEGRKWLTQLLASPKAASYKTAQAKALNVAGSLAWSQNDQEAAHSLYTESLTLHRELGNEQGIAEALHGLGRVATRQRNFIEARAFYEASLALWRELEDKQGIANTLLYLGGGVVLLEGNLTLARALLEESLMIWQELADKTGIAPTLSWLGRIIQLQGDYERAALLCTESLVLFRGLGDKFGQSYTLRHLGHVALCQGNQQQAKQLFRESLALSRELKFKRDIAWCLADLAKVACAEEQPEWAARLLGAAEELLKASDAYLAPIEQAELDSDIAAARAQLDEAMFAAAWAEGKVMTMEKAIAYATDAERERCSSR